jgi:hypothetical protein
VVTTFQPTHAIRSHFVQIRDFGSFLMGEVPYGQVDPRQMQGIIERAGLSKQGFVNDWVQLSQNANHYRQLLHWQFGAEMCPVAAAVRLQYLYTSPTYAQPTLASLLIGFAAPPVEKPRQAERLLSEAERPERIAYSFDQNASAPQLNNLLVDNSPYQGAAYSGTTTPSRSVEFYGLARDNDSMHPLPYTWAEVATDATRFDQLLHWTFGGTSYRICKAVRVRYDDPDLPPALLIGYHGPGGT